GLTEQALTALFVMLAAFSGDELVRRGWTVLRAFLVTLICASVATAATQWCLDYWFDVVDPYQGLYRFLRTFLKVGGLWGTAMLVYLNRQSASRLLASVRGGELRRVQAERRLIHADLLATEAQINPEEVFRQLAEVRDLYAAANPLADRKLEL